MRCQINQCHRQAVVDLHLPPSHPDAGEKRPQCIPCTRAYNLGNGAAPNDFEYDIRDDVTQNDIDKIREVFIQGD